MTNQLRQDPFVAMMLCAKAESNEADLIRLLTDDEYLIAERDKRLKELYKPETGESLDNQNAWKFLILIADEKWRAENPIVCDITDLPYKYGGLITSDLHLKAYFDGEAIQELQDVLITATNTLRRLRAEQLI
ncbi:hypothetical protein SEGD1_254 [Enterobacteria phage SEGD1]|jgi:hypothetical protein|uniref:Uncharacterized protein n=1 Tax=Enterobacteria phage SEGD1 TaxID=1805456 RepID=A0A142IIW3_9CAUD|nr:hypothetical protein SEGD1_254 [Enterobacteria phage SEGD1]EDM3674798.1 hypothetical protein [Salmonella enterica subsp. enterica serovar Infantis]EEF7581512.1 hypothetical protein [Salmonella enterica subsp. enterica serovar Heidelberg]ULF48400.1 hypothetical protein [Salmonella phage SaP7]HCJ8476420.1 hypothetical protein [Escherichia coli]